MRKKKLTQCVDALKKLTLWQLYLFMLMVLSVWQLGLVITCQSHSPPGSYFMDDLQQIDKALVCNEPSRPTQPGHPSVHVCVCLYSGVTGPATSAWSRHSGEAVGDAASDAAKWCTYSYRCCSCWRSFHCWVWRSVVAGTGRTCLRINSTPQQGHEYWTEGGTNQASSWCVFNAYNLFNLILLPLLGSLVITGICRDLKWLNSLFTFLMPTALIIALVARIAAGDVTVCNLLVM